MKKKRLRIAAFAVTLALCMGSTACSSESSYSASQDNYYAESYDTNGESKDYAVSTDVSSNSEAEFEDKIVRTADVYMESDDAQKCYDTLLKFAKENGGSELNIKKSINTYGNYEHFIVEATLKISPDKLDAFIDLAEKTDKVTSSQISADDVTQEYYDIKLRLDSKKEALKNYYKLLDEAQSVQDSLEIQRYITDLTAEIESMEGMLKYYDSKVDLSTINLTIEQQRKLDTDIDGEFHWDSLSLSDVGKLIKKGFMGVLNFLWMAIVWIFIAVLTLSPILLIALGAFLIVRNYRIKHPKKDNPKTTGNNYYEQYYQAQNQNNSAENGEKKK